MNGIALPIEIKIIADRLGLAEILPDMPYFAQNSRWKFYMGLLWTAMAAGIALFLPNSLQLMRRFRPNVDNRRISSSPGTRLLAWRILGLYKLSPGMAIVVGLLLFICLKAINSGAETEFLYFQF